MDDIIFNVEDVQAHVTVSAIIRIAQGSVGLCLFSPEGGECEVFLGVADALRMAEALNRAASFAHGQGGIDP